MVLIKLQPEPFTDQITEDGHELTKLPYPFAADETGAVHNQSLWQGHVTRVIGFQKDLAKQQIDLWWRDVVKDPQQAVGMYLVTADQHGVWGSHQTAIGSVEVLG